MSDTEAVPEEGRDYPADSSVFNAQEDVERKKEERYIEKFNSIKGMVYQVLRENEEARNSQEWTCHIVQRECAEEYFGKDISELSKSERLVLPRRSTIARHMRDIQNEEGKFEADEEVQVEKDIKRKAIHKNYSGRRKGVEKL